MMPLHNVSAFKNGDQRNSSKKNTVSANPANFITPKFSRYRIRAIQEKTHLEGGGGVGGREYGTFFYPTTHGIQFPLTPTTHEIRKFRAPATHRIKFS